MAEGWKQLLEDVGSALGFGSLERRARSAEPGDQSPGGRAPARATSKERAISAAPDVAADEEPQPIDDDSTDGAVAPPSARQRWTSFAGLALSLAMAVGIGWYAYFGGPKPPAPNVVATFDGGQITVEQVREHLALLLPAGQTVRQPTYDDYRLLIQHMLLNELVRRWAAEQKMDASARFQDAMRHISESVTLDEWVVKLHQDEMLSSVTETEIGAYYEANSSTFGNATLAEVREQIRQTLAHQNQEEFFQDYLARLREAATIIKQYDLLEVPAPTGEQVRKFYDENPSQFSLSKRAIVDRIFVPGDGTGIGEDATARSTAEEARAALQTGKDFAQIAGKYSQEPYNPEGVIIEAETDDAALAEQAFSLSEEGDLSPVIGTKQGYYVLRLREQQPARQISFEEARPQVASAVQAKNESAWFEQNADRTLFTIHGERFTLGQFFHEYQNLPPNLQKQFSGSDGLKELADLLIDRMLVLDDAYNRLVDQQNAPLLEEARTAILRQMMHEAEVSSQVTVTDQDVRQYYEAQKGHFVTSPEARIQSIRISLGSTEDESDRARARAREAYGKLVPGLTGQPADFDQVAKEYDESDQSPAGGELGDWIRMGDDPARDLLAHPLHQYIFALSVGGVSQPFEYGQDLYIVKVLERIEPKPLAFEEVKDHIRTELELQKHEQRDAEVAERLLRDARTTIYDYVIQDLLVAGQTTQEP